MNAQPPQSPPFPAPGNAMLKVVVRGAIQAYHNGVASAEQAILNAAVNAWYEGHIEGEDTAQAATSEATKQPVPAS